MGAPEIALDSLPLFGRPSHAAPKPITASEPQNFLNTPVPSAFRII